MLIMKNRYIVTAFMAALVVNQPAEADEKHLAYSKKEQVEIFAEQRQNQWCGEEVRLRLVADNPGALTSDAVEQLVKKLGQVVEKGCEKGQRLSFRVEDRAKSPLFQGTAKQAESWQAVLQGKVAMNNQPPAQQNEISKTRENAQADQPAKKKEVAAPEQSAPQPSPAVKEEPTLKTIKQEFNFQLPSMWELEELTLSDVIYTQDANPSIWKAKLMATIVTKEDTYLPTEYGLGTITVLRPIHKAGVKRKLFARTAARRDSKKGWEVDFIFDNDVTLSAGLPMNYFFGQVVIEGSDEYKKLGDKRLTSHIDATIKEHVAALAKLKKTHAAEVEGLKKELEVLEDVEALEGAITERIDQLQQTVKKLHHRLEETTTQLHTQGIVINQWAATALNPCQELPDDKESRRMKESWEKTRPEFLLGAPDNKSKCSSSRRINNAWSFSRLGGLVGKHFEEEHSSLRVEFAEAVIPTELTIYEVGNYRFVRRLIFHGLDEKSEKIINVQDAAKSCPGASVFQIVGVDFPSRSVTIEIDTGHENKGERFDEEGIDAIKITGVIKQQGS